MVNAVNSLKLAQRNEVSFLNSAKYLKAQRESHAGVVLVPREWKYEPPEGQTNIHCDDPDKAFTKLCTIFAPEPLDYPVGVHPTAFVHPTAKLAEGVHVGPNAVIMEGAEIGKNTKICACAYIGQETKVGENTTIYPGVCIMHRCIIGNRVIIHGCGRRCGRIRLYSLVPRACEGAAERHRADRRRRGGRRVHDH